MTVTWLLLSCLLHLSQSSLRPNIVFIVADDLGYQDVGFRGSDILTPNLDQLAQEGVILENHYVMPVCSASRSALLTGRYCTRTGFWKGNLNPLEQFGLGLDETTMAEMLKRNGYVTHGVGKWHVGAYSWEHTPVKRGFDTFFGAYLGAQDYWTHRSLAAEWLDLRDDSLDNGVFRDVIRDDLNGSYNTDFFTDRSVELIRSHDKSKPMFMYLAYTAPHIPEEAPEDQINKFYPEDASNSTRKTYATMVTMMDIGIGKVVNALKDQSMLENSILVFMSDNGARFLSSGSNYPLRGGKGSFFEGGVRAMTFVNSPLLQKTGYTNKNIHHVTDWYATFQQMVGDSPENHKKAQLPIDGVNIWDSINEGISCREEVLLNIRDPSMYINSNQIAQDFSKVDIEIKIVEDHDAQDFMALRWKNWKLIAGGSLEMRGWSTFNLETSYEPFSDKHGNTHIWSGASGTLLFDLSEDEREDNNLAEQRPDIVKKLLDKKKDYMKNMKIIPYRYLYNVTMTDDIFRPWYDGVILA